MEYEDRKALEVLKELVRKVEDGTIDYVYIATEIDYDDPDYEGDPPYYNRPTGIIDYSIHTHEVTLDTVNKFEREYQLGENAKQVRKEKTRREQAARRTQSEQAKRDHQP